MESFNSHSVRINIRQARNPAEVFFIAADNCQASDQGRSRNYCVGQFDFGFPAYQNALFYNVSVD